jgi:hypothetical protein
MTDRVDERERQRIFERFVRLDPTKLGHGLSFFSTDYRLYVGGRDKTALVAGMTKQAQAV